MLAHLGRLSGGFKAAWPAGDAVGVPSCRVAGASLFCASGGKGAITCPVVPAVNEAGDAGTVACLL